MSYIGNTPFTAAFLTDTFSGDGSTTGFTLSAAPANTSSIIVAVTGVLQDPSTYSVSGTTLTFSAAPPSGTDNISVRFLGIPASGVTTTAYRTVTEFTATAGQTTFSVPSYTVGYVDVYRNGVMLGTADFTASSGTTIVLASGATAGDLIRVESFYVSSVLNAIPATAGAVNNSYLGALSTITTSGGDTITVPDETGTMLTSASTFSQNSGPAFRVYSSSGQAITSGTTTLIQYDTKQFDTDNCYDTSTHRFTPTVEGYYQISAGVAFQSRDTGESILNLRKNGVGSQGATLFDGYGQWGVGGSTVIYLNGSTDYLELTIYNSISLSLHSGSQLNYFSGGLVRAA